MKKSFFNITSIVAVALLIPRLIQAQGIVYRSNLDQASAGGVPVASNAWMAVEFQTGTNAGGYLLNSIQLEMVNASGNPSGFLASLYGSTNVFTGTGFAILPGNSLVMLGGSTSPITTGIYTYTADSMVLSPQTAYFIVLAAATTVPVGTYGWSYTDTFSYDPTGGWGPGGVLWERFGYNSTWNTSPGAYPQFALTAMPIPEPGIFSLFALGSLGFLWQRRKT